MKTLNIILLCLSVGSAYAQPRWTIQDNYEISFSGTKAEGTFRGLKGEILFDPENLQASKFNVSIDVSTISTGNKTKDKHARGESWFEAETFPRIYFTSEAFSKKAEEEFEVTGRLKLKGIEKKMAILFRCDRSGDNALFTGTMEVNREDFGIEGNFFGFVVGDDFKVTLKVPVEK